MGTELDGKGIGVYPGETQREDVEVHEIVFWQFPGGLLMKEECTGLQRPTSGLSFTPNQLCDPG